KSELLPLAATLAPEFSIFLFDQRYFGTSEGNHTTLGIKEKNDLMRAIDWLNQKGYFCIGVFGHSFGGAVGMLAAAEDSRIQAIVSYGAFSDIPSAGLERYQSFGMVRYPIINAMFFALRLWIGDLEKNSPVNAAQKIRAPLLLAHGTDDKEVFFEHAQRLQHALKKNRNVEYYFPEKTGHAEFPEALKKKTKEFFIKHLAEIP
ncbi:alpha/beta fold hydrolase, partial [Patescibacteria group bacterium]|nr:alpha/beta fold hydrolase [Patescibacteria group bacterium]